MITRKYKFGKPSTFVEVSISPKDVPEKGNAYTIFDCFCRPFGDKKGGFRRGYEVTAPTYGAAARFAMELYRKDFENEKAKG